MSTVKKALSIAVQANVQVLIWGQPGTGKTSAVNGLGESVFGFARNDPKFPIETVISAIREPTEFVGLPHVTENGEVDLVTFAWVKRLVNAGQGILFLDEVSCAPPAVQAAVLRVVLEKMVGDTKLPQEVRIVMAANPTDIAANGHDLSGPLSNRVCHLQWNLDNSEFCEGLIGGFNGFDSVRLPENWRDKYLPVSKASVASFCKSRPNLLLNIPSDAAGQSGAYPTPRSWEMAATLLAACQACHTEPEVESMLISGAIGDGAAVEFLEWRRKLDLPDPEHLLTNCSKWEVPKRGDITYAILASVAAVVVAKNTKERWNASWKVVERVIKANQPDVAAVAARTLARNRPNGVAAPKEAAMFIDLFRKAGV